MMLADFTVRNPSVKYNPSALRPSYFEYNSLLMNYYEVYFALSSQMENVQPQ